MDALQLGANSSSTTLNGSPLSENIAVPVNSAGKIPTYTYMAVDSDIQFLLATDEPSVPTSVGGATVVTAATGASLTSQQPLVVNTRGYTHIMTIGTASDVLILTPLEN